MPGNTHSFRKKENMGMLEFMHETLNVMLWNFFTQDAKLFLIVYYYLTDYKYNNLKQYLLTKRNSHNS